MAAPAAAVMGLRLQQSCSHFQEPDLAKRCSSRDNSGVPHSEHAQHFQMTVEFRFVPRGRCKGGTFRPTTLRLLPSKRTRGTKAELRSFLPGHPGTR
eukprot:2327748-Rhodomonas_salina.2